MTLNDVVLQFVVIGGLIIAATAFLLYRTFRVKQTTRVDPVKEAEKAALETCVDLARYEMDKAAWEKTDAAKLKRAELAMNILRDGLKEARRKDQVFAEIKTVELYIHKLRGRLSQAQIDAEPDPEPFKRKAPKPEDLELLTKVQAGRARETYRHRESKTDRNRVPVLLGEADEESAAAIARSLVNVRSYSVTTAGTMEAVRERLHEMEFPVLMLSQRMIGEGEEALDLYMAEMRELHPETRLILICNRDPGYKERRAFERQGVFECVARPVENYGLTSIVDRAIAEIRAKAEAAKAARPEAAAAIPDPEKT